WHRARNQRRSGSAVQPSRINRCSSYTMISVCSRAVPGGTPRHLGSGKADPQLAIIVAHANGRGFRGLTRLETQMKQRIILVLPKHVAGKLDFPPATIRRLIKPQGCYDFTVDQHVHDVFRVLWRDHTLRIDCKRELFGWLTTHRNDDLCGASF